MEPTPDQTDDQDDIVVVHVMPRRGGHEASRCCWCQPTLDRRDPLTGAEVWLHNAYRH